MQVRIFCSTNTENIIKDNVEFITHYLESHDNCDFRERLVIYEFYETCIEKIDELTEILEKAESIKDRFLLFLLKKFNYCRIEIEPENDPNLIEITIS